MARLPTPGGDSGNWGSILNDYLSQAHELDGTLKDIPQNKVINLNDDIAIIQSNLNNKVDASALVSKVNIADLDSQTATRINDNTSDTSAALANSFIQYIQPSGDTTGATDTAAINTAIATAPPGGTVILARGQYTTYNLRINNKTDFKLQGQGARVLLTGDAVALNTNSIGIELAGTISGIEITGLHIVGDGMKAHKHAGIWGNSGTNISDLSIHHNSIEQVIVGISVNANLSGTIDGFSVCDNVIKDIVGIASGQGYGIHVAYLNSASARGTIARNRIYRAGRHSIYCARASDVDIIDNLIYGHRSALTVAEQSDPSDGHGKARPAILVARSHHIRVAGNSVTGGYDTALSLIANPNSEVGTELYGVQVIGNQFKRPQDASPLLILNDATPSVAGSIYDVQIESNFFWADFSALSGVSSAQAITFNAGRNVKIKNNVITIRGVNTSTSGIQVFAKEDDSATALYTDEVEIEGNTFHLQTTNTSTCRGIRVDTSLLTSKAKTLIKSNEASGDAALQVTYLAVNNANPNFYASRSGQVVGLYIAGDTSPTVGRGITQLDIQNPATTSITTLDDPMEGQIVTLQFYDNRTTLVQSGTFQLLGGVDWQSAARRTITMRYHLGSWYQIGENATRIGTVIARTSYAPASRSTKTTTSTSFTAIDAANMTVSFVAPVSGKVTIRLNGLISLSASGLASWALLDHTTGIQVGGSASVSSSTQGVYPVLELEVTGLTVGQTYQYDWAWATSIGTTTLTMQVGLQSGSPPSGQTAAPAVMTVLTA